MMGNHGFHETDIESLSWIYEDLDKITRSVSDGT